MPRLIKALGYLHTTADSRYLIPFCRLEVCEAEVLMIFWEINRLPRLFMALGNCSFFAF